MIKKLLVILMLVVASLAVPLFVDAQTPCSPGYTGTQLCNAFPVFGGQSVNNIPTLIQASFTWLASVIGTLAMVMIIFAGAQMIFSQGDPQAVTRAKSSLTYALYGLAIVIFAYVIVSGIEFLIGAQGSGLVPGQVTGGFFINPLPHTNLMNFIATTAQGFLAITGTAAMLYIVLSGFRYVTSRGNEEAIKKARAGMTWAILGLISIILSYFIISVVVNTIARSSA